MPNTEQIQNELLQHLRERSEIDRNVALSLQALEMNTKSILSKMDNIDMRVNKLENMVADHEPKIGLLLENEEARKENSKFWNRTMIIKAVNIAAMLALTVLLATGILTLNF